MGWKINYGNKNYKNLSLTPNTPQLTWGNFKRDHPPPPPPPKPSGGYICDSSYNCVASSDSGGTFDNCKSKCNNPNPPTPTPSSGYSCDNGNCKEDATSTDSKDTCQNSCRPTPPTPVLPPNCKKIDI